MDRRNPRDVPKNFWREGWIDEILGTFQKILGGKDGSMKSSGRSKKFLAGSVASDKHPHKISDDSVDGGLDSQFFFPRW